MSTEEQKLAHEIAEEAMIMAEMMAMKYGWKLEDPRDLKLVLMGIGCGSHITAQLLKKRGLLKG